MDSIIPVSQIRLEPSGSGAAAHPDDAGDALELRISGLHCAACVSKVEQALSTVPGVTQAAVNLATDRAYVRLATPVPVERLADAVRAAGYRATPVTAVSVDSEERERAAERRSLERRFAVAAILSAP